jgi:hypothetical protein
MFPSLEDPGPKGGHSGNSVGYLTLSTIANQMFPDYHSKPNLDFNDYGTNDNTADPEEHPRR